MSRTNNHRVNNEAAFLLTSSPWRESSLRLEVFSRHYGRVSLIARSARKRQSDLRGVLVPFVPLELSWYGENDLRILHRANWIGGWAQPVGKSLLSSLYINELILKLMVSSEPLPAIFDALMNLMPYIVRDHNAPALLRRFEWQLLELNGWADQVDCDELDLPVDPSALYRLPPECRPYRIDHKIDCLCVHGATLLNLSGQNVPFEAWTQEALYLTRYWLDFFLEGQLKSRKIIHQLAELKGK